MTAGAAPTIFVNSLYAGGGNAAANSCVFSTPIQVSATLTIFTDGTGTWVLTHLGAGVTFTENVTGTITGATTASFSGSTTQTIGGQPFSVTDSGTISGNNLTDTQTLTRQGSAPCTTQYNISAQKQ